MQNMKKNTPIMSKKLLRRAKLDFPQPVISLKIVLNNKRVLQRHSTIKSKVYNFAKKHWSEGCKLKLKVTYKKGIENEGVYKDWENFVLAWETFTEENFCREVYFEY